MSGLAQARLASPLFQSLNKLEPRIRSHEHISLFLDFDGTLSPIVPQPSDAALQNEIRPVLKELAARKEVTVAIVSGRSLSDVQKRVGLEHLIYVGNHGLEIEGDNIHYREPRSEALRRELKCVILQLKLALGDMEGVEIEDKGLTASVHFRRVSEELQDWVRGVTCEAVNRSRSFATRKGKMIVEIRPQLDWNKGHALKWILSHVSPAASLPIYIGDDTTDEDAFAAIPHGITVKVGELAETQAQYALDDVPAVAQFLTWLSSVSSK